MDLVSKRMSRKQKHLTQNNLHFNEEVITCLDFGLKILELALISEYFDRRWESIIDSDVNDVRVRHCQSIESRSALGIN